MDHRRAGEHFEKDEIIVEASHEVRKNRQERAMRRQAGVASDSGEDDDSDASDEEENNAMPVRRTFLGTRMYAACHSSAGPVC